LKSWEIVVARRAGAADFAVFIGPRLDRVELAAQFGGKTLLPMA